MPKTASVEQRVHALRDELDRHNHLYYVEARPAVSDREYDRLMQELIDLEKAHPELISLDSPTQRVGEEVQSELKSVRHAVPMMSIDNTYTETEVRAFDERVRKALGGVQPGYVLEPKIDGASVSLRYENGRLVLAATRGRGNVGDDVTVNARTIRAIPLTLRKTRALVAPPSVLEVRGEVYMDNEDFQRVNRELEAEGEAPYANPRNLTSGTLRRLDPRIVAKRRLRFLAHGVGQVEPMPAKGYFEWTELLRRWGLPLPQDVRRVEAIDEAIQWIHEFERVRPKLPYMTDGMVLKVDAFAHRDKLGATSKAPRWVIAYKYETEQQPATLNAVRWQVGKGGTLTPVGDVEPVFIAGVTVTHVTLHNLDQIRKLDAHLGDTVVIERAGEVIPYVRTVLKEKRPKNAAPVAPPKNCPSCGSRVVQEPGTPQIRCPNPDCPAQVLERLVWFAGRGQMEIDGLGEKIVEGLVERGYVRDYADLFALKPEQIAGLTRESPIGSAKAESIIQSLEAAKPHWPKFAERAPGGGASASEVKAFLRWLDSPKRVSLKGVGDKTIDQLVDSGMVKTPADLFELKAEQIAALPLAVKVGEKTAARIIQSIKTAKSRGLARVLGGLGIRHIGTTVARELADWGGTVDKLLSANERDLRAALSDSNDAGDSLSEFVDDLYNALRSERASERVREYRKTSAGERDTTAAFLDGYAGKLGLGARIGSDRRKRLAEDFPDLGALLNAERSQLLACLEDKGVVARSVYDFFQSDHGRQTVNRLKAAGVVLSEGKREFRESAITGKTVVITGTFSAFLRKELADRLESLGAKVTGAVTRKTHILLVGADPGSKVDKATELGVEMWLEERIVRELNQA